MWEASCKHLLRHCRQPERGRYLQLVLSVAHSLFTLPQLVSQSLRSETDSQRIWRTLQQLLVSQHTPGGEQRTYLLMVHTQLFYTFLDTLDLNFELLFGLLAPFTHTLCPLTAAVGL